MKTPSALPDSYVQQLNLRSSISTSVYRSVVTGFHRFASDRTKNGALSETVLQEWLRDRISVWPLRKVVDRACLVSRYLDWIVEQGILSENPFAKLKGEYGQRAIAPIVRALLSPNSRLALEALRPAPRFGSFLGPLMRDHISLMRSMGYRYQIYEKQMLQLDRFLQSRSDLTAQPIATIITEWYKSKRTPEHALQSRKIGRAICRALLRIDPNAKGIAWDRRVWREARLGHRRPYILNEAEIRSLLATALSFPGRMSPLRAQSLYTMLVLAYGCGLRLGEIVRLNVGDVDLEDEAIEIRGSKFFKTRRLPLSPTVAAAVKSYLKMRSQVGAPSDLNAGLFWHQRASGRYTHAQTRKLLTEVFRRAGIKPKKGRIGPRIHDLRHAFVAHRMLTWYREGVNPQSQLPYLATYLGHRDISSTLVYLNFTEELLQRASERFREFGSLVFQGPAGGGR
jgi:integrase